MKSFVGIFACSAAFGLVIALTYWWVAHEEVTGTILLGIMTAALVFAASYAVIAERNARLDGDDPQMTNDASAGEDLGVFTTSSAWPILIAASAALGLCGILWSPLLAVAGFAAVIISLWRMGAESSRV
ncbi:MAG TPA: cytochrome c oxidase subunit 4 [Verrucomicrobiae bacterium]|nr:cytochrome c oxidase subunit 4 [Verrucomicrobiae bacterium]